MAEIDPAAARHERRRFGLVEGRVGGRSQRAQHGLGLAGRRKQEQRGLRVGAELRDSRGERALHERAGLEGRRKRLRSV